MHGFSYLVTAGLVIPPVEQQALAPNIHMTCPSTTQMVAPSHMEERSQNCNVRLWYNVSLKSSDDDLQITNESIKTVVIATSEQSNTTHHALLPMIQL